MTDVVIDPEVFNPVYIPYLKEPTRTQIFYGGSGSGKSVFIAQRCVFDLMTGGRNYLICRQIGRTLRGSVFTEVCRVINQWGVGALFNVNKSDMLITCQNGYQIIFAGLDDVEKLKSLTPAKGVITDIWVEEATEVERASLKQLYKRQRGGSENTPKRMTLTFNPIMQSHWIYQDYFSTIGWTDKQSDYKNADLSILKTTYKDNRFLTTDDAKDLERETDSYYYKVYTLGEWGILGNVIFTNWSVQDLSHEQAQFTNRRVGLDFGFSSDPAALTVSHYDRAHKTIYVFDELYERGLTNDVLAKEVKDRIGGDYVTCDSSEPKSIAELTRYGVNARGAKKGKDSVEHGLQWLQQQTIIVGANCINTRNELQTYKWREDAAGNPIRQPVDRDNHLIDALRYAYEGDSNENYAEVIDDPFAGW